MTRQSKITGSAMAAVPSRASPAPITNSRVSIFFRKCVFIFLLYQRGAILFLLHRFRASIRRSCAVRKWVEPYHTLGLKPQNARPIDPNVWQGGQASTHIPSEHSLKRLLVDSDGAGPWFVCLLPTAWTLKLFLIVPSVSILETGTLLRRMVPRDGVEPPTPAFSGLRSTT